MFSLSEDDDPSPPLDLLTCKGCGQFVGDPALGAGLDLGAGLGAELYCLSCEEAPRPSVEEPYRSERAPPRRRGKPAGAAPTRLFSCLLCSFASRYSNHLKRHMSTHDGQKPFRCPACPYASAQLVNLQRHARTHTGEKPYRCPHCSYACSSHGNLRRHQRMHTQEAQQARERRRGRRKKAEEGTLRLSQDPAYLQSLGGLGPPSGPLPVLLFPLCCRLCGLTLEEANLQGDRAEGEVESDGGQVCRRCSEAPCSPDGQRGSRRGTKFYRCGRCPFLSRYPHHLARHAHTHSEEKPHRCPHCAYTSSHPDNLKRHLRVHTGEKPYRCSRCSYACGNLANLRRHQRVHSGCKPYACSLCSYTCNQSMNLKRHMLRHTGLKPYACPHCRYATGHWDNYKRHQRKHGHGWDQNVQESPGQGRSLAPCTGDAETRNRGQSPDRRGFRRSASSGPTPPGDNAETKELPGMEHGWGDGVVPVPILGPTALQELCILSAPVPGGGRTGTDVLIHNQFKMK